MCYLNNSPDNSLAYTYVAAAADGVKTVLRGTDLRGSVKATFENRKEFIQDWISKLEESGVKGTGNDIKETSKVKFSAMTADEQIKIAKEYSMRAPIKIPDNAKIKPQSKNGYEQITYKWSDESYKYEVRWHTRTPGAPENQGNTWVVQRTIPGNGGNKPATFFKIGDNEWVEGYKWYDAISARKSGTATPEQIRILDKGHWKD